MRREAGANPDPEELALIDAEYTRHRSYGSRKMMAYCGAWHPPDQPQARPAADAGIGAHGPGARAEHQPAVFKHKVHPYLLRGLEIDRPGQVWSADIMCLRLPRGFVYLVVAIDWYSHKALAWRVSNRPDSRFCVDGLEQALRV